MASFHSHVYADLQHVCQIISSVTEHFTTLRNLQMVDFVKQLRNIRDSERQY